MTIFVSAGHHPAKQGASFGDFSEHPEAVSWAITITDLLLKEGLKAQLVPVGVLQDKVDFINDGDPSFALEIHFNSFKIWEDANKDGIVTSDELHNAGKGSEVLHYPNSNYGIIFATNVQRHLSKVFKPDRGVKDGWYRMNPKFGPDYFLAKTKCPSIIIEPDFIHRKHKIQSNRVQGCHAIVEGTITTVETLR